MFLDGNPIVYAGAIERVEGEARTGDWVQVTDHALSPICYGFYNETSSYSVRALSQAWERGCEDGDGVVPEIRAAARALSSAAWCDAELPPDLLQRAAALINQLTC